jgi:hypothetical protein
MFKANILHLILLLALFGCAAEPQEDPLPTPPATIIERPQPSVEVQQPVGFLIGSTGEASCSIGSAFYLKYKDRCFLITARHVIENTKDFVVDGVVYRTANGKKNNRDLYVQLLARKVPAYELHEKPEVGKFVEAYGFVAGRKKACPGVITDTQSLLGGVRKIFASCVVKSGMSGGALLCNGKVVGVISSLLFTPPADLDSKPIYAGMIAEPIEDIKAMCDLELATDTSE